MGSNGASASTSPASLNAPGQGTPQRLSSVDAATQAAEALITRLSTLPEGEQEEAILDTLPDLIALTTIAWMRLKRTRDSGSVNQRKAITGEDFVRMEEKCNMSRQEAARGMGIFRQTVDVLVYRERKKAQRR